VGFAVNLDGPEAEVSSYVTSGGAKNVVGIKQA
jgi:hypothetical protein